MTDEKFGRYLLGELLWELDHFSMTVIGLTDMPHEQIEVLAYSGYRSLQVQTSTRKIEVQLSWKGDIPPIIVDITEPAELL